MREKCAYSEFFFFRLSRIWTELNTHRYSVSLRSDSECGEIRTRKTPNTYPFHVVNICKWLFLLIVSTFPISHFIPNSIDVLAMHFLLQLHDIRSNILIAKNRSGYWEQLCTTSCFTTLIKYLNFRNFQIFVYLQAKGCNFTKIELIQRYF